MVSSQASRVWMVMGRLQFAGQFQLLDEDFALDFARREIVVVVEADFAERHHFGMGGQGAEIVVSLRA